MLLFAAFDLVGWSTVALAFVTAVSVILGYRALRQGQAEIALNRDEVQQSHRPLLSCTDAAFERWRSSEEDTSLVIEGIRLSVENVGAGPAIDVVARVQLRGDDGRPSLGGGSRWWSGLMMGIKVGGFVALRVPVDRLAQLPCFAFELTYADLSGQRWYSTGIYLLGRATGVGAVVVQPKIGRVPDDGAVPAAEMPQSPDAVEQAEPLQSR